MSCEGATMAVIWMVVGSHRALAAGRMVSQHINASSLSPVRGWNSLG